MTIRSLGLLNTLWALVLHDALPIWSVILLMNFFRELPRELEEAAIIDGASHWDTLFRIYLPLSAPALATLTLFSAVGHWNAWFDGMVLIAKNENYPIMTFLRTVVVDLNLQILSVNPQDLYNLSDRSIPRRQHRGGDTADPDRLPLLAALFHSWTRQRTISWPAPFDTACGPTQGAISAA